ncbi:hypothetical protein ACVMII_004597 [Bradyrhizobium diazoefficiens]
MLANLQKNPWRLLLAINAVVLVGVFVHKIQLPPYVPYIHLLVDYHFGFIKRALIGAVVALFTAKVPVWLVFALGGMTWLVTLALFARLFQKTFGFAAKTLPLFVFIAGSPFFLKNFMHTLGHFDIYGCALTIILLLMPAGSLLFVATAALFSIVLVLIHHIHLLMYVPTIIAIVVIRHYLACGCNRSNVAFGVVALAVVSALFFAAQFLGTMPIPEADFVAYLKTRMVDPLPHRPLAIQLHLVPAAGEGDFGHLGPPAAQHPRRAGVCASDLAAHAAVALFWQFDRRARKRDAPAPRHRRADRRQPRLSRDVRDGVRLFALDLELGGLHVPDPACGEDAAGQPGDPADPSRGSQH